MRVGGVVFGCLMVQGRGRGEEKGGTQKKKKEGGRKGWEKNVERNYKDCCLLREKVRNKI